MSEVPDWVHQDVSLEEPTFPLNDQQANRLLTMVTELRENFSLLEQVVEIKRAIADGDLQYAHSLFGELSPTEKYAVWVAPKFGGIFTTHERKVCHERPTE